MTKRKRSNSGAIIATAVAQGIQGYLKGLEYNDNKERQDKADAATAEDRALRREEVNLRLSEQRQQAADRQTLRDAGATREALPGTAVTTGAGDKNLYTDPAQAAAAAEEARIEADMRGQNPAAVTTQAATGVTGKMATGHQISTEPVDVAGMNTPAAKSERVIAALDGIDPLKAMDARQVQTQRDRETVKFTQEQQAYAKKLKDEGVFDALKALRSGNAAGVVEAFNRGGDHKIDGDVAMTKEMRDIPGLGQIPTYTAKFNVVMPDGSTKPMSFNSHDLGMSLMPYEKNLDLMFKGQEAKNKGELTAAKIDAATARAEASRARAAGGTGASSGPAAFDPLDGWDAKQAQTAATKMVDEMLAGRETKATPQERAELINRQVFALRDSWSKHSSDRRATEAVAAELRASRSDPSAYASAYSGAQQLGMTPEMLSNMGFQAPAAKPAAGGQPVSAASGTSTKKPTPAPAPAAPGPAAAPPSVAAAMGVRGDGSSIDKAVGGSVAPVEAASAAIAGAKARLAAAAKSGDASSVTKYAKELQAARNSLDVLLKDMNAPQAEKVRAAAGY